LSDWYTGPKAALSFRQGEREHDNFRVALSWGLQHGHSEAVLDLVQNLFVFWLRGGYWQGGKRWAETAVANRIIQPCFFVSGSAVVWFITLPPKDCFA